MYEVCGMCELSEGQKKKLMKGCGVRVSVGDKKAMLSQQQSKKLKSAGKKGVGMVLHLDPYQVDMLKGGGFFSDMVNSVSAPVRSAVMKPINKIEKQIDKRKKKIMKGIEDEKEKLDEIVKDAEVEAKKIIEKGKKVAEKVGKKIVEVAKSDATKRVGKKVAGEAIRKGIPLATGAVVGTATSNPLVGAVAGVASEQVAEELAQMAGVGAKKKKGGALRVAGYKGKALRVA
jgi:vacuolar-type H+-ATPase subunit H